MWFYDCVEGVFYVSILRIFIMGCFLAFFGFEFYFVSRNYGVLLG